METLDYRDKVTNSRKYRKVLSKKKIKKCFYFLTFYFMTGLVTITQVKLDKFKGIRLSIFKLKKNTKIHLKDFCLRLEL